MADLEMAPVAVAALKAACRSSQPFSRPSPPPRAESSSDDDEKANDEEGWYSDDPRDKDYEPSPPQASRGAKRSAARGPISPQQKKQRSSRFAL